MKNIFYFMLILIIPLSYSLAQENTKYNPDAYQYKEFIPIKSFSVLNISLKGSADSIGLNEKVLEDFLKLSFKKSFANINNINLDIDYNAEDIKTYYKNKRDTTKYPYIGEISINIWFVGKDYPLAYYISLKSGNIKYNDIYEDGTLGYCGKQIVQQKVQEAISSMVDNLALTFFKARGEL